MIHLKLFKNYTRKELFELIETVFGAYALEKLTITVVGAGPAGLLAAYRLKQASLNVKVVEARPRVGGRLFSAPSIQAEFGAWSLANGGCPELFQSLARELGLEIDNWFAPFKRLLIVNNQFSDITYRFLQTYDNDPDKARRLLESIITLSDTVQEVLDSFYQGEPALKSFSEDLFWGYFGSPASELSAKLYRESLIQLCLGGVSDVYKQGPKVAPLTRVKGGNDLFTKKLAEYLADDIELNKPLEAVRRGSNERLILQFKDGSTQETDVVICAIPVGAYNHLTIDEGLIPSDQLASIRKVSPGTIKKVLIPALGKNRPPGFISVSDYGAAMSEHERFLTLYWRAPLTLERCKEHVEEIAKTLGWDLPSRYIHITDDSAKHDEYPHDAVYMIDWTQLPYTYGSFCAYSKSNDGFVGHEKIDSVMINKLFKPSGRIYFVGEAAGVMTPPGTLAAAFESAENVAALIKQRLSTLYSGAAQACCVEKSR